MSPVSLVARITARACWTSSIQDYIRTARAKGVKERSVIFNHALRNAMIPVLTVVGAQLTMVVGGSFIIESVFSIPGSECFCCPPSTPGIPHHPGDRAGVVHLCVCNQSGGRYRLCLCGPAHQVPIRECGPPAQGKRHQGGGLMFSKKAAAPTVETLERHSQFVDIWRRFKRNKLAVFGMGLAVFLILMAVFANFIAPYDPGGHLHRPAGLTQPGAPDGDRQLWPGFVQPHHLWRTGVPAHFPDGAGVLPYHRHRAGGYRRILRRLV